MLKFLKYTENIFQIIVFSGLKIVFFPHFRDVKKMLVLTEQQVWQMLHHALCST